VKSRREDEASSRRMDVAVKMRSAPCPATSSPSGSVATHLDQGLIAEVEELVELDTSVLVLLERSGGLLGGGFLSGGEIGHDLWDG